RGNHVQMAQQVHVFEEPKPQIEEMVATPAVRKRRPRGSVPAPRSSEPIEAPQYQGGLSGSAGNLSGPVLGRPRQSFEQYEPLARAAKGHPHDMLADAAARTAARPIDD